MSKRTKINLHWLKKRVYNNGECWQWRLGRGDEISIEDIYKVLVGPLWSSHVVRHTCCNEQCVRPEHLDSTAHPFRFQAH